MKKILLSIPIITWFKWFVSSRKELYKNKGKNLLLKEYSSVSNSRFGHFNTIYEHAMVSNSYLRDYVYIGPRSLVCRSDIGRFCSIGPDVKIGLGIHPLSFVSTFPAFFSTLKQCQESFVNKNKFRELGDVKIGNDVWIGANAIILDGITIGDGAVVAAGAVVVKDVEAFSVVGGVPARVLKKRFEEQKIKLLLEIKWWDRDISWIKEHAETFDSLDIFLSNEGYN